MLFSELSKKDEMIAGLTFGDRVTHAEEPTQENSRIDHTGDRNSGMLFSTPNPLLVKSCEVRDVMGHKKPPSCGSPGKMCFVAGTKFSLIPSRHHIDTTSS